MAEDDVQLMACPWCGSLSASIVRGGEDEDYNPDDQAVQVIKKFRCNACGKEFAEPRRYGTSIISMLHFDEMGDNQNYVWFHGVPEEEYRAFKQYRPDRCLTPTQYRVRKMEAELGVGGSGSSWDGILQNGGSSNGWEGILQQNQTPSGWEGILQQNQTPSGWEGILRDVRPKRKKYEMKPVLNIKRFAPKRTKSKSFPKRTIRG